MTKKCKVCKKDNANPMNPVCSVPCAIEWAKTDNAKEYKEKAVRSETRQFKSETSRRKKANKDKDKPYWVKKLQIEVNYWIRNIRDKDEPCISCGTTKDVQYCAGHYKTRGSHPELRFEPDNIHRQCNKNCNLSLSGNVGPYRVNLIEKIGLERVLWLEGPHKPKKYTIDELKDLIQHYRKLNKEQ